MYATQEPERISVGTVTVKEGARRTKYFECAAWYQELDLTPGTYELYAYKYGYSGRVFASLPGTVTKSCFDSLWGGVAFAAHRNEDLGAKALFHLDLYTYEVGRAILERNGDFTADLHVELRADIRIERWAGEPYAQADGSMRTPRSVLLLLPGGKRL
jgi:hypothetical protein